LYLNQQPAQTTPIQPEGQGTPSLSPTPSPAGSVGSVGSQSSGYSSGELANRGAPGSSGGPYYNTPHQIHAAMIKQSQHLGLLLNSLELWDQAISKAKEEEHRGICKYKKILDVSRFIDNRINLIICSFFTVFLDFFVDLDQRLGPLTQNSSLRHLVRYVQAGIKKLRAL